MIVGRRVGVQQNRTGVRAADQSGVDSILSARVKTKVWLELNGRFAIGDGGLHLLQRISATGSLAAAVREIGWSYRHAWGYLRRAEEVLGVPLIIARPGKGAARGASLTAHGRLVLERLAALRQRVDDATGPSGPTREEIAARGATRPTAPSTARRPRARRRRPSAPSRSG